MVRTFISLNVVDVSNLENKIIKKDLIHFFIFIISLSFFIEKTDAADNFNRTSISDLQNTRLHICNQLNGNLPLRLDSCSTLLRATVESDTLVYYTRIKIGEFIRMGKSIGQRIPDLKTVKKFIYIQTLTSMKADPSYSSFKKIFKSVKHVYVNQKNQILFEFTISFQNK